MTDDTGRVQKQLPCRHCKQPGTVGRDLMPYLVQDSKGAPGHVWLHQETCSPAWHEKFRVLLAGWQAARAGSTLGVPA